MIEKEDVDELSAAMSEAYTYEGRDNSQPTLPFADDFENFWDPFAAKVLAALDSHRLYDALLAARLDQ